MVRPDTSTQMNSRKKSPALSPLTAALSCGSVVATVSPVAQHSDPSGAAVEPVFVAHEVCHMLKFGRTTLFKLVKSGELVPLRITARIRVWPLSTIEAFIAKKRVGTVYTENE